MVVTGIPLFYFSVTTANQIKHGVGRRTETVFKERNFATTWFTYGLIVGEIGAISLMIAGFIYSQFL
jgi:hypothetical protein